MKMIFGVKSIITKEKRNITWDAERSYLSFFKHIFEQIKAIHIKFFGEWFTKAFEP